MERIVGFDEFCWLSELAHRKFKVAMPEYVATRLVTRGLIERNGAGFTVTARGRIALANPG